MDQPKTELDDRRGDGGSDGAPLAVLIAGPTASGKSALALALAARVGGVVLNADSMQVYADLAILTARPCAADLAQAPHRLYGHVDANTDYSVGRYVDEAARMIGEVRAAGRLPILVGGTGLYFRALTQGLAAIPAIPPEIRARVRAAAQDLDAGALHARLAGRDPETAARLGANDRQRVLRALEVLEATGRPLAQWQKATPAPVLDAARCVRLVIEADRDLLRARIDARFCAMIEAGALEEVRALAARGLPTDRTLLKAHGVPALMRHLAGDIDLAAAVREGQSDTRRYAKRQDTFFRHQMADWPRSAPADALDRLLKALRA